MKIHSSALSYFDMVRRCGSIREAARQLNIASSAVNRQILKLENEIGAPLFERHASGIRLTTAGEMLTRHVIVVMQDLERVKSDIEGLKGARLGHISLGAAEMTGSAILTQAIQKLHAIAPRITLDIDVMPTSHITQALENGDIDIGLAFDVGSTPNLKQVYNAAFQLGAIMAADHPLASNDTVTLDDCRYYPIVATHTDLPIMPTSQAGMAKSGRELHSLVHTSSQGVMRHIVMHSQMIGFQTVIGLEDMISDGKLAFVPLNVKGPLWRDLGIHVRADRVMPRAPELFMQLLVSEFSDHREQEQHQDA